MSWIAEGKEIAEQILKENPNTRVKSALLGGDKRIKSFAIGTPENPMDWEDIKKEDEAESEEELKDIRRQKAQRSEENNKRRKRFETWLKDGHFKYQEFEGSKMGFVKVNGVYKNSDITEHSYFIINPNIGDALHLFKHFGQQAFIFAIKDKDTNTMTYQLWIRDDINENYKKVEEKKNVTSNVEAEEFFSSIHDFKFNIPFDYFNESIRDLRNLLDNCSQNDDFYIRLDKQVYNKIASGWNSWLNRGFLYETVEHRKKRLERVANSKYNS